MVRILTYLWVLTQVAIVTQIYTKSFYINMELLKLLEIICFVPIILILAKRTRELRQKADFDDF